MQLKQNLLCIGISIGVVSCSSYQAPLANIPARQVETKKVTAGGAQVIKKGMPGNLVIDSLGTPNIITSNNDGGETWIYDKISKEYEYITAQDNSWFFSPRNQQSGVISSSERSLIVVVTFDAQKNVSKVTYRQSSY